MNTFIGVIAGILVTILVARYYFQLTTKRNLGIYLLLNSNIFAGIMEEVRKQLHFTFGEKEVSDLQQMEFLIANDGEQAISNVIEPLSLTLPPEIEVLDASILYRSPENIKCSVNRTLDPDRSTRISLDFPLLNKREYFLVKLLLSGHISSQKLSFTILSDDLPRVLSFKWLPLHALQERKLRIEWPAVIAAILLLGFVSAMGFALYSFVRLRPDLFPYPLSSFKFSFTFLFVIVPSCIGLISLAIIGMILAIGVGLEDMFSRGPRFPLPKEFRQTRFAFPWAFLPSADDIDLPQEQKKEEGKP